MPRDCIDMRASQRRRDTTLQRGCSAVHGSGGLPSALRSARSLARMYAAEKMNAAPSAIHTRDEIIGSPFREAHLIRRQFA